MSSPGTCLCVCVCWEVGCLVLGVCVCVLESWMSGPGYVCVCWKVGCPVLNVCVCVLESWMSGPGFVCVYCKSRHLGVGKDRQSSSLPPLPLPPTPCLPRMGCGSFHPLSCSYDTHGAQGTLQSQSKLQVRRDLPHPRPPPRGTDSQPINIKTSQWDLESLGAETLRDRD